MFNWINMSQWYGWVICVVLLVIGVFLLVKCSDIFVDGSSTIAKKMKISPLIIGLTVVAFGTSFPELAVSTADSIGVAINGGNANVALGNVVGSNICNLLLVLGFSAAFTPIIIDKSISKKEYPILIFVSVLLTLFGLFFGYKENQYAINRIEASIFVVLIIAYIVYIVIDAKKQSKMKKGMEPLLKEEEKISEEKLEEEKSMSLGKAIVFIILGLIGIALGGQAVVESAKKLSVGIGTAAGLNEDLVEALVGLTVVAVGTSLPELVTSVVAAKKGENEIALGNVIGSNIFNILFVLGIAGLVTPLTVGSQIVVDLAVMLLATFVVFIFVLKRKIGKTGGIVLIVVYFTYIAYLVTRTILGVQFIWNILF